jgi:glycosyltransferase involved in cell wall biosynthesis
MNRILIVNSELGNGGITTYTLNLCKGLIFEGNHVYLLVTHNYNTEFIAVLKEAGVKIVLLNKFWKYFKYPMYLFWVQRIRPDIILNNYNFISQLMSFFDKRIKLVHIIHNDTQDFYRVALIMKNKTSLWVAPTPLVKSKFIEYSKKSVEEEDVVVINHGVEMSDNVRVDYFEQPLRILFAGALYEHKGVDLLCKIFSHLKFLSFEFEATIIGSGPLSGRLIEEISGLNLKGNVRILGQVNYSDTRALMSNSDVLLFPTRIESFGLVIIEAMMEGVIPIVSLLPGITDNIIEEGVSGYLVEDYLNPDKFIEKILLLKNLENRLKMSQRAKSIAESKFSLDCMMNEYKKVLSFGGKNTD